MLVFALHFARELERFEVIAELELFGKPNADVASSVRPHALLRRAAELFTESMKRDREAEETEASVQKHNFVLADMFDRWTMMTTAGSPEIIAGVESLLSSLLLGTWTAFETMAGDLWEASLNFTPTLSRD
jgi:hypothetical protein